MENRANSSQIEPNQPKSNQIELNRAKWRIEPIRAKSRSGQKSVTPNPPKLRDHGKANPISNFCLIALPFPYTPKQFPKLDCDPDGRIQVGINCVMIKAA